MYALYVPLLSKFKFLAFLERHSFDFNGIGQYWDALPDSNQSKMSIYMKWKAKHSRAREVEWLKKC